MTYKEYAIERYGEEKAEEEMSNGCPWGMFNGESEKKVLRQVEMHCDESGDYCEDCWDEEMLFEPKGDK